MVARHADSLFYNGRVLTLERKCRVAQAVAVEDGRISAVGKEVDVRRCVPRDSARMDLRGRTMVPGFIDCHTHFVMMGVDAMNVDLSGTRTIDEALALMRAAAKKAAPDEMVIGANWKESGWRNGRFMTGKDLDKCCPKNAAIAHRVCGHLSSANTLALKRLAIDASTPGTETDASGRLTGVLKEEAVALARAASAPSSSKKAKALAIATQKAHALGVTSVHDNGHTSDLKLYQSAARAGKLGVRVWFNTPASSIDAIARLSLTTGLGDDWLRLGGLKVFCDGALGARTAALSEPYADDPGNKGMLVHEASEFQEIVSKACGAGIQLAIHAIGDVGIETTVAALERALVTSPREDARHRIEHLELPSTSHLRRMRRSGIIASMQPNFVGEWGGTDGMYRDRLGAARARRNNPFREVLSSGVRMVFGSDCMPFSPLYGIHSAVNAPHRAQRITVTEAIAAFTREAAYASFDESVKGTISPGKLADMVVLSADPFAELKRVSSMRVVKTLVGGEVVYDSARSAKSRRR